MLASANTDLYVGLGLSSWGWGQGCVGVVTSCRWFPCTGDVQLWAGPYGCLPSCLEMCMFPSLRSVALCLNSLVLSLQCDVPLGVLAEKGQSLVGWGGRQSRWRPLLWAVECYSLCLQSFSLILACWLLSPSCPVLPSLDPLLIASTQSLISSRVRESWSTRWLGRRIGPAALGCII